MRRSDWLFKRRWWKKWWSALVTGGRRSRRWKENNRWWRRLLLLLVREWVGEGGWAIIGHNVGKVGVAGITVERERRENWQQKEKNSREGDWFFINFAPDFLHARAIKSTPIYKEWNRDMLSLMVSNISSWFSHEGSQPLDQSECHELSNLAVEDCMS